ncbi:hypothetical protein M758_UG221500 [Ceratodon purpureus]|nr:hypothetical protein M758_UG221500 [Ceratodon purpureus]
MVAGFCAFTLVHFTSASFSCTLLCAVTDTCTGVLGQGMCLVLFPVASSDRSTLLCFALVKLLFIHLGHA